MNRPVRIRTDCPTAVSVFAQLLSTLPDVVSEIVPEFLLESSCSGWSLRLPDRAQQAVETPLDAFYAIESFVYDHLLPDDRSCLIVHGAALLHIETASAVLLAGPSHCGKSTLSLALVASGGFAYLSEEAVGVDLNGNAIPYPKPFRIRFGGERLIAGRPGWNLVGTTRQGIQYVVPPRTVLAPRSCRPRIRCAVFPEFVPGVGSSAQRKTRGEGTAWLANCSVNHPDFLASRLSRLSGLLQSTAAWTLKWSEPEEAAESIRELIGGFRSPRTARVRRRFRRGGP